jgi:hypothetical protein
MDKRRLIEPAAILAMIVLCMGFVTLLYGRIVQRDDLLNEAIRRNSVMLSKATDVRDEVHGLKDEVQELRNALSDIQLERRRLHSNKEE